MPELTRIVRDYFMDISEIGANGGYGSSYDNFGGLCVVWRATIRLKIKLNLLYAEFEAW